MKKLMGIALAGLLVAAGTPARALDLEDVLQLLAADVEERTILQVVESEEAIFHLDVEDILDLKELGASDDFIRRLMDTPERYGKGSAKASKNDYDYDLYDDDYSVVFLNHYYDPFGYYWYASPRTYVYYSPFWWNHHGFYYAGHWCWDWWDPWNPCVRYWDVRAGYAHHWGHSRTAPAVRTARPGAAHRTAVARRTHRARTISRRAGVEPPMVTRTVTRSTSPRATRTERSGAGIAKSPRATYRSTAPGRTSDAPARVRASRPATPKREATRHYRQSTPSKEPSTAPRVKRSNQPAPTTKPESKSTPRVSNPKQTAPPKTAPRATPRSSPAPRTSRRTRT